MNNTFHKYSTLLIQRIVMIPLLITSGNIFAQMSGSLPPLSEKFIALYVSPDTRKYGYAVGENSETIANNAAQFRCNVQKNSNNANDCIKIISGKGVCLGISSSADGAIGAVIRSDAINASIDARFNCANAGGRDCPFPSSDSTVFCQK